MKIILVGPTAPYKGGISHYNTTLFKHLSKQHVVELISWKRRYPNIFFPGKDQMDIDGNSTIKNDPKFILDSLNPLTWVKTFLIIKKKRPDLVVFHWVSPFMSPIFSTISFLTRFFTKTKIMLICHNVLPHERNVWDIVLTKFFFNNVDYFIVHSKEDLLNLKKVKKNAEVKLGFHPTYNQFNTKKFDTRLKKSLNLGKKVILFFGYIRKYKGLDYLLEAMPYVLEKIDCNLLVVGEFWEGKEEYINIIKKNGISDKVRIIDKYVPDQEIGYYFEVSDVVVIPYITATQSGIVQTAYGFDKPVITTNVGGLPDAVGDNKTGFIVPPKDPKALADVIIRFYQENKSDVFIKNIKLDKDKFSWDKYLFLIDSFFK